MKSFSYLCRVKRMKMVISSVGMLMLSAQFASSDTFPSNLRRSLALKSNIFRSEGLPDGQSIRNGRTADGERQREKGKRTEIRETIQGKQVKGSNSKSEGILMNGSFKTPIGKSKTNPLPPRTSPPFKGGREGLSILTRRLCGSPLKQ